jgi:hypothetical protein
MKRISLFLAATTAAVIGSIGLGAGVASAWHPVTVGQATCQDNGSWTVEWTAGNSETDTASVMTFDSATVNGASIALSPNSVPASGSASGASTHTSATSSATLVVTARWASVTPNEVASRTATVNRPENCVAPTTTTVAATTTTVAATTTTVAPTDTTTLPAVTRTAAEIAPVVRDVLIASVVPQVTTAGPGVEAVEVTGGSAPQSLPATGAVSLPLVVGCAGLLLVGGLLVVAARRYGTTV